MIVTLELQMPETWTADFFGSEIFHRHYAGSWAYGVSQDAHNIWLIYDVEDAVARAAPGSEGWPALEHAAEHAWQTGDADLPAGFYVVSPRKLYAECVKLAGVKAADCPDLVLLDRALQRACFGKELYG